MIPLAVYSHFSLMWGTAAPAEICLAARQKGYTRLALTDRDNLYGLWPFLAACGTAGITPIIGAELSDPQSKTSAVALVENELGYKNLCWLISQRQVDAHFGLAAAVAGHAGGLIFLASDISLLRALRAAGASLAAAMPCFPASRNAGARAASRELGIPLVATPASVFLQPEDYKFHCLLRAIHRNTSLSRLPPEDLALPQAYLATPGEYARRFEVCPEAVAATHALAQRCAFTGPQHGIVLPPCPDTSAAGADEALRLAAYNGAQQRYGQDLSETVVDRLEKELRIIAGKGFSSYFLVVQDIIRRSPRICGRGSAAASLVAYALGITNVCPIKHNLYFERFLNPGRADPPDIDVDFAWDERDQVIHSVLHQYAGRSAMVCNHVCFQPRMAIREVAKVYGLTDREIGQISKRLPWLWHADAAEQDLQSRLETLPELKHLDFPQPWPEVLGLAQKLIGAPRYISVHSGGVVITPRALTDYAPWELAPKGVPIVQWEKDGTEDSGLVKIDLLGNRSLGVIRDALANIQANGLALNEAAWEPETDPATRQAVAQGKTMGCFYIESPAMRLLQQKAGVGDFEHLVIHSSIIRPAANVYIREYVRRLKGGAWAPLHPLLADVLDETFGIMVYQEDVSKTAVALAGFSHAEADGLRKILTKKNRAARLRDYQERFAAGARERGVSEESIAAIWAMMMSFDGYSFCKPHSASYAQVSFQAAFLKVHFPAEFMAAVISNQGGFYSTFAYVSEARRLGVAILPPDVNASGLRWHGRGKSMRVGFLSIHGLSSQTSERLLAERQKNTFQNLNDFLERVEPGQEEGRALIHSGACDSLAPGSDRAALVWALSARRQASCAVHAGQTQYLAGLGLDPEVPPIPAGPEIGRLRLEFNSLGFLCERHPMSIFSQALARWRLVKARDLKKNVGRHVRVAGWLLTGKIVPTQTGEVMEFITFEDETGLMETTFFPDTYRRFCDQLDWNRPFLLAGMVEEDFGAVTLVVENAVKIR